MEMAWNFILAQVYEPCYIDIGFSLEGLYK